MTLTGQKMDGAIMMRNFSSIVFLVLFGFLICYPDHVNAKFLGTLIEDVLTLGNSRVQREERRQERARKREQQEAEERLRKEKIKLEIENRKIKREIIKEKKVLFEVQIKERMIDIESLSDIHIRYMRMEEKILDFLDGSDFMFLYNMNRKRSFGETTGSLAEYITLLEELLDAYSGLNKNEREALRLLLKKLETAREEGEEEFFLTILEHSSEDASDTERDLLNITKMITTMSVLEVETKKLSKTIGRKREENQVTKKEIEDIEEHLESLAKEINDLHQKL